MALAKDSIIDQIELLSSGHVQIRIKLIITDGDSVVAEKFHRTAFPPEVSPEAQMAAVNAHLAAMGEALLSDEDLSRLSAICAADRGVPGRKADYERLWKKGQVK